MPKKNAERVYLNDEEKKILAGLIDEWNGKGDKKSRDAFVAGEALPKIQELNVEKFGPTIISKDKAAKLLWERRVQVRIPKENHGPDPHFFRRSTPGSKTTSRSRTGRSSS